MLQHITMGSTDLLLLDLILVIQTLERLHLIVCGYIVGQSRD